MEKSCRNCAPKVSPRSLFNFAKYIKTDIACRKFFQKFWKMIIKEPLKSQLYFFIRTQSLLMDKSIKNKRDLELVISRSSGYETSSEKFPYPLYHGF